MVSRVALCLCALSNSLVSMNVSQPLSSVTGSPKAHDVIAYTSPDPTAEESRISIPFVPSTQVPSNARYKSWTECAKPSQLQSSSSSILDNPAWNAAHSNKQEHCIPESCPLGQPNTALSSAGSKRGPSPIAQPFNRWALSGQPPLKKARHKTQPQYKTDPQTTLNRPIGDATTSLSLFGSNTLLQRPSLPIRLSSSEPEQEMLSKARDDHGGTRTLKLARGAINPMSPSRETPTPGSLDPLGTLSTSMLQDDAENSAGLSILTQVGVREVLEHDDRPTFIIDLGDHANFEPGPLHVIYANTSLLAFNGLLDKITGRFDAGFPGLTAATAFSDFKAWATSYVRNHECLDVSLPSFFYDGITWTCCSLRKRLRLIRCSSEPCIPGLTSNPSSVQLVSYPTINNNHITMSPTEAKSLEEEPPDYFSSSFPPTASKYSNADTNTFSSHNSQESFYSTSGHGTDDAQHKIPLRARSSLGSSAKHPLDLRSNRAIPGAANVGEADPFPISPQVQQGFFDWTRLPVTPALPRHIQFARSVDWASTSLGRIEDWSSELRSMCNLIMASPHPAAMYWGDDLITIYNEAYILLAGQKHPRLMGQMYREAWPEIWGDVGHVFDNARLRGQATMKDDDCLFMQRSTSPGFLEETYFSWALIPLVGVNGSVVGVYNPAFEKTRRKIAERRMLTLRDVGEKTAAARDLKSFWRQVLGGLANNALDTPFVLLYSLAEDINGDISSEQPSGRSRSRQFVLEGSLGVPEGHKAAPPQIDLQEDSGFLKHAFGEAMKTEKSVLLQTGDGTLDSNLFRGIEWRGFGDPCKAAVCCSISLASDDSVLGFLVMGVNPRRPYDDDYSLFVQLLSRQLATSMASVVLFAEEIAKGKRAARRAAVDRIELSEKLAALTQEAIESETRFTRMAGFAPVGIFIADSRGRITYCNDMWYEISQVPKKTNGTDKWMDSIKNDDKNMVMALWSKLVDDAVAMNAEFRFKKSWEDPNGNRGDTWVLASAYPEKDSDGRVKGIFGSITNISQQKWAEHFEKRRMEEAVEMKRQQENFIDITSHEMRNPLSAILQCADEISTTLSQYRANGSSPSRSVDDLMENSIDAAQTIALCAQHQKRIVDDILTLSKLDSALLLVTPCDVMPISVVQRALKMFDGEVHKADIELNFQVDDTFAKCEIDWVKLDPSRLLQVLINLTTNAIKFTSAQKKRIITVRLGASLDRPSKETSSDVSYFPTRAKRKDLTKTADWGKGERVFIHFAVQDTGRGLSEEETKLLFLRFSQASPRTHVQYGGSGLGLFISRELVELQGGEIGVSSKAGEGSTFAFYVKARRSTAPIEPLTPLSTPVSNKPSMANSLNASEPKALPTPPSRSPNPVPKENLRFLIVEDNLVNQRVLQKQLRNLGCIVYVANHGGDCLDLLQRSSFWRGRERDGFDLTVILMDLEMPVMDGLTCARRIRELQRGGQVVRHVPIIAVSANARIEQINTALSAGMVCLVRSTPMFP